MSLSLGAGRRLRPTPNRSRLISVPPDAEIDDEGRRGRARTARRRRGRDHQAERERQTVRVYSRAERDAWTAETDPVTALALRLLLRYGLRFGELFFALHAFEADGPRLAWMKGRKRDVWHTVPLLEEDAQEIAARVGRAQAAKLETIWYEEKPPKKDGDPPRLETITYYGLQARLRSSSRRAGIRQGRVIHGARHHAGTMAQRAGKNAKATQRLLGHLDPRSTNRYVHAMDEDVLAALLEVEKSQNSPEPAQRKKRQRKAG